MANHNYEEIAIALDCNHFPLSIYSYIGKLKKQGMMKEVKMILKQADGKLKIFKDMGMNKWRETKMAELEKGVCIRIYSPNGRPLETGGEETFMALTDACLKLGQGAVKVRATS